MTAEQQALAQRIAREQENYLKGRIRLPSWVQAKRARGALMAGDFSVAAGATGDLNLQVDDDAHFLVEAISIVPGDQSLAGDGSSSTVQFTDTTSSFSWSNNPVTLRDAAGLGTSPKVLADPQILRPSSTLNVQITNNESSTVQYYCVLIGRKIYGLTVPEVNFLVRRKWYQYVMTLPALAASAVGIKQYMQLYNDSDFLIRNILSQQLLKTILGLTGGSISNEIVANFRDTTTGIDLSSDQFSLRAILGALTAPVINASGNWSVAIPNSLFRRPWLVRRNGQVLGTFTNLSTSAVASGQLIVFEGARIFDAL